MNSIKKYTQWCKDNGYKPSDGKAILAYDIYRNFKPRGLLGWQRHLLLAFIVCAGALTVKRNQYLQEIL